MKKETAGVVKADTAVRYLMMAKPSEEMYLNISISYIMI